jgi:hypothetical protein
VREIGRGAATCTSPLLMIVSQGRVSVGETKGVDVSLTTGRGMPGLASLARSRVRNPMKTISAAAANKRSTPPTIGRIGSQLCFDEPGLGCCAAGVEVGVGSLIG